MHYELERIDHLKKLPVNCRLVSIMNSSPHWHYDYEIIFVLKESLILHTGAENYILQEGDIVLVNSCEIHSFMETQQSNLCLILQFDPSIIAEEFGEARKFLFKLNTVKNKELSDEFLGEVRRNLARLGNTSIVKPDGYQFLIRSYLYKLISDLFCFTKYEIKNNDKTLAGEDTLSTFDKVNEYIKMNFAKNFSVSDLCKDVGISKSSLYRLLSETSLSTYKDLVDFYRIEYSKNLLKNTKNSIAYIASVSGFESDSSFFRSFKKIVGVSPNAYRNDTSPAAISYSIQGYAVYDDFQAEKILKSYL